MGYLWCTHIQSVYNTCICAHSFEAYSFSADELFKLIHTGAKLGKLVPRSLYVY